jgi:hypothetical protein
MASGLDEVSSPDCTQCRCPMELLGRLPRRGVKPTVDVYRCIACKTVVSELRR